MTNLLVRVCGVLLFTTAIVLPAAAQSLTADQKELASYTITMPTVKKMAAAIRAFAEAASQDPKFKELAKVKEEIKTLENKDDLSEAEGQRLEKLHAQADALEEEIDRASGATNAATIDEMAARINAIPQASAALAKAGLTAREFSKCTMALFQAAMIKGLSQGKVDLSKLPPGVNPANITFVEEHEQELLQLQKEMQALQTLQKK